MVRTTLVTMIGNFYLLSNFQLGIWPGCGHQTRLLVGGGTHRVGGGTHWERWGRVSILAIGLIEKKRKVYVVI